LLTDGGPTGFLVPFADIGASGNENVASEASSRIDGTSFLERYRFVLLQFLPKAP
jgi:hypothetical protein